MTYEVVEARRIERPRYAWAAYLGACVAFAVGVLAGVGIEGGLRSADLTSDLPSSMFSVNRVEMPDDKVVVLHFLSDRKWRNVEPMSGAAAFTEWNQWPCTIYAPATNFAIVAYPAAGYARWEDLSADEYLSHEVLHCLAGSWHPDWKTITATQTFRSGPRLGEDWRSRVVEDVNDARKYLHAVGSLR